MTPQKAAALLSLHLHRGEACWQVLTIEGYVNGQPRLPEVRVSSRAIELLPEEAIAIALFYRRQGLKL